MSKQFVKDGLGWGFVLWLVGYVLGIVLFGAVAQSVLGWVIMPIGIAMTLWVLFKKVQAQVFQEYVLLAVAWTTIAILFDYLLIVKALGAGDYYKLDVYLYYLLTFTLPLIAGWKKATTPKVV